MAGPNSWNHPRDSSARTLTLPTNTGGTTTCLPHLLVFLLSAAEVFFERLFPGSCFFEAAILRGYFDSYSYRNLFLNGRSTRSSVLDMSAALAIPLHKHG